MDTLLSTMFQGSVARPKLVLTLGMLFILIAGSGLTRLVKDTSVDAFVPPGHEALLANDQTTELFGLSEPIAVAVFAPPGRLVFEAEYMAIVEDITLALGELENIREDRIASIASESSIRGFDGAIEVESYIADDDYADSEDEPADALIAEVVARWRNMPPHVETLVSKDGRGAVVLAEVVDPRNSAGTYLEVRSMLETMVPAGLEYHVAGPAAVTGFLSEYIDADARVLLPFVFLVVLIFLYLAFLKSSALLGPIVVLLGSAGGALGIMAWFGVPYFAITNALPVILVAISVADAIHILSAYFESKATHPKATPKAHVVAAMEQMARPITLTTITTMAGFLGIAIVSIMPPIYYFAVFAMLGVAIAWAFSLLVLPAILMLVQPSQSHYFKSWSASSPDLIGEQLAGLSALGLARIRWVCLSFVALVGVAWVGATDLSIDRSQVDNFAADEPIRIADDRINETFAGTAFLDVIVRSSEPEGLLKPENMRKIAMLQGFLEQQEHVTKTISIVDYLALLDDAITETQPGAGRELPSAEDSIAQYLMVYEASGDPTDFDEEITRDYQSALIRGVLDSSRFSESRKVLIALQRYIDEEFATDTMSATIAGDVNVAYHWMTALKSTHFLGIGISLVLIFLVSSLVFRSLLVGAVAVVPVTFTVLCLYGVMGYLQIDLEPATSMFAAISVGVGVDFAIHFVDRILHERRMRDVDLATAVACVAPSTGRACFFNAAALGLGFAVLTISDLPTLQRFGGMVTVAAVSAFLCSLIIIPTFFSLIERWLPAARLTPAVSVGAIIAVSLVCLVPEPAHARSWSGIEVATRVAEREEARSIKRTIVMTLKDKRGRKREREAMVMRSTDGDVRSTRITYLAPKAVRELTFLSKDFMRQTRSDERWLYIPAVGKVRRIPASDRGDYFLGTDFTYEDMQSDLKFDVEDYNFEYDGTIEYEGKTTHQLSGRPVTKAVAKQLGYGSFSALVDERSWFPVKIEFFNLKDQPLKTVLVAGLEQIDGVWTPARIEAQHHRTGHRTLFEYTNIEHSVDLPKSLFNAQGLVRGIPGRW